MRIHKEQRLTKTSTPPDFVDITADVESALAGCGIGAGHVFVSSPDGCAVVVNESESGLLADLKEAFGRLGGDSPAVRSRPVATSVALPAADGRLRLGVWQRVLLVELDEPNERAVDIQIVGD